MLFVRRENQPAILNKAVQRTLKISVAIRDLGKCVLPQAGRLIPLRSEMKVEFIEGLVLYLICMLMALPVIPT